MGVARWGALSMMKGCNIAFVVRNGVFEAMLAREGFTSTEEPFDGIFGLQHFTGPFDPVDRIESIGIEVATGLDVHLADEPKYDPGSRETACHSLPYMVAQALVDSAISFDSNAPERIADPSVRPLMRRIRVHGMQR